MTTNAEYKARISGYDWDNLITLWSEIEGGNTSGWDAGKALEYLVLRAFQLDGAEVTWPYSVPSDENLPVEQIDGVIYADGLACLIECKDTSDKANVEPIAKLRNQLLRRPGTTIASIFSRNGFTKSAITLSNFIAPQTILLWRGEEIKYSLQNNYIRRALIQKYRYCIENGMNYYDITTEAVL
jgi:hypothetical protein